MNSQIATQIQDLYHISKSSNLEIKLIWIPSHNGILGNERADRLAKQAITDGYPILFPYNTEEFSSLLSPINRNLIQNHWSTLSGRNKLLEIKNNFFHSYDFSELSRKDNVR